MREFRFKKIIGNYDVNTYNNSSEIPEKIQGKDVKPNYETLLYYYWMYVYFKKPLYERKLFFFIRFEKGLILFIQNVRQA